MESLRQALNEIREKILKYRGRKLNEENTKATLINPVLRALGWDLEDVDSVQHEYKVKRRDKPVDYALFSDRRPVLFVEAKALGQDLGDHRWANQIMGYASVAGVPWVVLTNGDEYQMYNAHAAVPVDRKMFRAVRISASPEEAAGVLGLIVPSRMVDTDLEKLWQGFYVDQEVRASVEELFGSGVPHPSLVNAVKKHTQGLSTADIRSSLARARISLDFPAVSVSQPGPRRIPDRHPTRSAVPKGVRITFRDLIAAGIVRPPFELRKEYGNQTFLATVDSDGKVLFRGEKYSSPSRAGGMALKTARGAPPGRDYPATDGWTFWQFVDRDGETKEIDELRKRYLSHKDLKVVGKVETDREKQGGR